MADKSDLAGDEANAVSSLAAARKNLLASLDTGGLQAGDLSDLLSAAVDEYFRRRLEEALEIARLRTPPFALLAVGGFGRSQLCPGSDIDVLLVHADDSGAGFETRGPDHQARPDRPDRPMEAEPAQGRRAEPNGLDSLSACLFHPLWDLRLSVGHAVRSISECLRLASDDPQVLASLLDMRFLAGDETLFADLRDRFHSEVAGPGARSFAAWLAKGLSGDAPGLEPDLKNGPGGLRDAHRLGWLLALECVTIEPGKTLHSPSLTRQEPCSDKAALGTRMGQMQGAAEPSAGALLSPEERREIEAWSAFLLAARVHLHALGGKGDVLPQDLQPAIAARLGFAGHPGQAAEALLARLHEAMTGLRAAREALLDELLGRDVLRPGQTAEAWPEVGFLLFLRMAFSGLPLSWTARRVVRHGAARMPHQVRAAPMALPFLRRVLPAPHGAEALAAMQETGFLAALLPEFGLAQHLVQFDGLHKHPLGRHSTETVRELAILARSPRLGGLFEELSGARRDALFLAGLVHDVGKVCPDGPGGPGGQGGQGGQGHEERGADLARDMLQRLGAPKALVADVACLVANHARLPVTAVRADLGDEAVAASVARAAGSLPRLTMLHLLGVADSRATGPRAWNGWKAALMGELYAKARGLLERGWLSTPHAMHKALTTRDKVRSLARGGFEPAFVEAALAAMPPRYVQVMSPAAIVSHFPLIMDFRKALEDERTRVPHGRGGLGLAVMRTRAIEGARAWEVTMAAMDQPRFFATVAGVMALHGLNILHAEIFTWSDGTVLDVFTVSEPADRLQPEEVFERVRLGVKAALTGKLLLDERLAERRRSPLLCKGRGRIWPPEVRVDNESSDFHTLVEVRAGDRPGRLFELASALDDLGLSVSLAKIGTLGERVLDIFFVRDRDGQKLDQALASRVEQALLAAASS